MPMMAPHPCGVPSCGKLTHDRFCPDHKRVRFEAMDAVKRASSSARGYDRRWQRLRLLVLHRDPICKICDRQPSTVADHIKAKRDGGKDEMKNLQGVCAGCHAAKTVKDTGAKGGRTVNHT